MLFVLADACVNFTFIFGLENVKPLAFNRRIPSRSVTVLIEMLVEPDSPSILTTAEIGALLNPYRHRATSDRMAKS